MQQHWADTRSIEHIYFSLKVQLLNKIQSIRVIDSHCITLERRIAGRVHLDAVNATTQFHSKPLLISFYRHLYSTALDGNSRQTLQQLQTD